MTTTRHLLRSAGVLLLGSALMLSLAVPALAQGASDRAPGRSDVTPPGLSEREDRAETAAPTPAPGAPAPAEPAPTAPERQNERPAPTDRTPPSTSAPGTTVSETARDERPTPSADRCRDANSNAPGNSGSTPPQAATPRQNTAPATGQDEAAATSDEHATTHVWNGRGRDSEQCGKAGDGPRNAAEGWIHWVFATAGDATGATLTLSGTGRGTYDPHESSAAVWHFYTGYFDVVGLEAQLSYTGTAGPGGGLVISDFCPGISVDEEIIEGNGPDDNGTDGNGNGTEEDGSGDDGTDEDGETVETETVETETVESDTIEDDTEVLGVVEEADDVEVLDDVVTADDDEIQASEETAAAGGTGAALAYTGLSALAIVALGLGLTMGGGGLLLRRRTDTSD